MTSRLLHRGAEAVVRQETDTVVKKRIQKPYRHPSLDTHLREERTATEVRILQKLHQIGVPAPTVQEHTKDTVVMDYVPGDLLTHALTQIEELTAYGQQFGRLLAQMHAHDIVHGDTTPHNVLVWEDTLYIIDCGLSYHSQRDEDKAMDLHVLRQAMEAAYPSLCHSFFTAVIDRYKLYYENAARILQRLEQIESRGKHK